MAHTKPASSRSVKPVDRRASIPLAPGATSPHRGLGWSFSPNITTTATATRPEEAVQVTPPVRDAVAPDAAATTAGAAAALDVEPALEMAPAVEIPARPPTRLAASSRMPQAARVRRRPAKSAIPLAGEADRSFVDARRGCSGVTGDRGDALDLSNRGGCRGGRCGRSWNGCSGRRRGGRRR